MKHTIVASKAITHNGVKFLPGDELDVLAFGENLLRLKMLIKGKVVSYGVPGRSIKEVVEASGFEFDEKNWKVIFSQKDIAEEEATEETSGETTEDTEEKEETTEETSEEVEETTEDTEQSQVKNKNNNKGYRK